MGAAIMLVGYVLIGIAVFLISKKLFEAYPFADIGAGKFWWSKYLPMLGFALMLMTAAGPVWALILGALLIIAGIFFLP